MPDFRMPAEWERQSATWTSWPHNVETWPENLVAAQAEFVALVNAIAASQSVMVLVPPAEIENVKPQFRGHGNVQLLPIDTNDAWARDYCPTFATGTTTLGEASILRLTPTNRLLTPLPTSWTSVTLPVDYAAREEPLRSTAAVCC